MEAQEIVRCRGHSSVLGTHPTTFEVTCEEHLTPGGNCIIGVAADKGCAGLSPYFKSLLANDDAVLVTRMECGGIVAEVRSHGSSEMTLGHPSDMVWRRSRFLCDRTIGIMSDHVARTLPRDLMERLARGEDMVLVLTVTRPG